MIDPVTIAKLWLLVKPLKRMRNWRNKRRLRKGLPPLSSTEDDMKTLIGALKSKTMWFGLLQVLIGAAAVFFQENLIPMLSADPSALWLTGLLTWILRWLTDKSLEAKA